MKIVFNLALFLMLSAGGATLGNAQAPDSESKTGIATLFARDAVTQSLCLKDGGPGGIIRSGQVFNRCSDVNFGAYAADAFSVGVEGGREGVIIDLGTPDELKASYGYTETVGNGQGFASLDVKNGKVLVVKNFRSGTRQELRESSQLFDAPKKSASAPIKLGHIYLIRLTDRHDKAFEMFAKILVLAHIPNESVTVRWSVISDNETAKR